MKVVTVAIGWQIYAAMDLKLNITILDTRIKEVEELKKHFGQQQHAIEQLSLKNKHITGYTWGESVMKEQNYTGAFRYFIISLSSSLQLDSPINVENILLFIQKIAQNISNHTKCSKEYLQDVIEADKVIRSLRTFALIEDRYKTSYEYILSKIEIDDNQK